MIDLNHKSGFLYGAAAPRPPIAQAVSAAIDTALCARHRAGGGGGERARTYVSSSGLGRDCLRQIQYDFLAVPKDEGQEFAPRTLRIFEAGHRAEDIVAGWFRIGRLRPADPSALTAASSASEALGGRFKGHIDGCFVSGPVAMDYPALWENKALGAASWKDVVKARRQPRAPCVCCADRPLSGLHGPAAGRRSSPRLNRDTMEFVRGARAVRRASRARNVGPRRRGGGGPPRRGNGCRAPRQRPRPSSAAAAWRPASGTRPVPGRHGVGEIGHDP